MQQQNQQNEANNEIGRQKNQRKIRSTSHSRLRSSNDLVNNIVTSKSIENSKHTVTNYNTSNFVHNPIFSKFLNLIMDTIHGL